VDIVRLIETVKRRDGLSLEGLARRAREAGHPFMSKSTLGRLGSGKARFPERNIVPMAAALDVPVLEIILAFAETMDLIVWHEDAPPGTGAPGDAVITRTPDAAGSPVTVITTGGRSAAEVEVTRAEVKRYVIESQAETVSGIGYSGD
jgi:hypothetical protein